jgi:chromosome partitioning protein
MSLGIPVGNTSIATVLTGETAADAVIHETGTKRLHILPASPELAQFERNYSEDPAGPWRLKETAETVMDRYAFTVIDTPPTTGLLTQGALVAAREVYIPMQPQFLAMEGMVEIIQVVEYLQRDINRQLQLCGVIPTLREAATEHDDPTAGELAILAELRETLGEEHILPSVRRGSTLSQAPGHGRTIYQHDLRGTGSRDYFRVTQAILSCPERQQLSGT